MRRYTWLIVTVAATFLACGGQKSAVKENKEQRTEENKIDKESLKKLEEEKKAKEQEEQALKEEVAKKKELSEKDRLEMQKVRQRLKKMGLAAVYVPMKRSDEFFVYQDNTLMRIKGEVINQGILNALNDILKKETERDNESMHVYQVCSGGFETCYENRFYIYYMEKKETNGVWTCEGQWFEVDAKCEP